MDEFAQFINENLLQVLWEKFSDGRESITVQDLRPMMHELVMEYARKYRIDQILDTTLTQPYVDKLITIVTNKLDIDKNGKITREEFIQFENWIPRGMDGLQNQLIVDLTQLESFMTAKILDEIWIQFDPQQTNKIEISDLRLMFHCLFEKYSQSMGLQSLIDSETVTVMSLFLT